MRIFLSLTFAVLSFLFSTGQPPKGANLIIIKNVNEDSVTNVLINAGYEIKSIIAHNIVTEYKNVNSSVRVKLNVRMKEGNAYLTGRVSDVAAAIAFGYKNADDVNDPIQNKGMKGSTYRDSWNNMDKVAKLIGTDIEYAIEKK
ncbi:hypothetical protein [Pinibacter aurantiacus]|uniref:Uncharacterized protein n=1 Tax=Pinibacter aurantiacus TaxID=2851599 RepID=A0A9E2W2H7_9BACT|nr:hypothetical protein [Pinibacter aurantiacus]MBV4357345.1 hypothetical protein [Pinibacter aurantiacus]